MGNRAVITLEDAHGLPHPVAIYVHWNGGLERVLAFVTYTWDAFPRGSDDVFTFQLRLAQVIGNFFPDGLSLYGYALMRADEVGPCTDNGRFHFRIAKDGITLVNRSGDACDQARRHAYWHGEDTIFDHIRRTMPQQSKPDDPTDALIRIATQELGIDTLDTRHSDSLDFHDLHVVRIRTALQRAYHEGRTSASLQQQKGDNNA